MTAHIVYQALDAQLPATLSAAVIDTVIRGRMGFEGVLVTDDLAMKALSGAPADMAVQAITAGCDIALYCNGDFARTQALLQACPPVSSTTVRRLLASRTQVTGRRLTLDAAALANERQRLLT